MFIVIDGPDGTGKQTQSELLKTYFEQIGKPVALYSFPRYETPTGQAIKAVLSGEPFPLLEKIRLFANDRLAAKDEILTDLAAGKVVICDRYITSMIVYAMAEASLAIPRISHVREAVHDDIAKHIVLLELVENEMPVADLQIILALDTGVSQQLCYSRGDSDINEKNALLQEDCLSLYRLINDKKAYGVARQTRLIECTANTDSIRAAYDIHEEIIDHIAFFLQFANNNVAKPEIKSGNR